MPDPTGNTAIIPADRAHQTQAGGDATPGSSLQTLTLRQSLPGLNEMIGGHGTARVFTSARTGRTVRVSKYDALKKRLGQMVALECRAQGIRKLRRAQFTFVWTERNKRRDPDNIAAGGRKIILDGLVKAGVLGNDGWAQIAGWSDVFMVGAPGVVVYMVEVAE